MNNFELNALDFKYLLLEYYKKLDISENELVVILMIDHLISQNNNLITADLLTIKMNLSIKDIDSILSKLVRDGLLEYSGEFSIEPLKNKVINHFRKEVSKKNINKHNNVSSSDKNIYEIFEAEFNRMLTPIEISMIGEWINYGYSIETITGALKDSLKKGKKSVKSIDSILLQWQKREDINKTGHTAISDKWDKSIEETIEIAKAKWVND